MPTVTDQRHRRRSRGQSLAEFAIVLPVFFLIMAGTIQLGFILWGQNTLNQLARDTGRYAATLCPGQEATAQTWFGTLFTQAGGPWKNPTSTVAYSAPGCPDDNTTQVWVTVTGGLDVPIFFPLVPVGGHLTTKTEFRVEPKP
jgi:Flp pilus assembly protein TadG